MQSDMGKHLTVLMKFETKSIARTKACDCKQNEEQTCPGGKLICHMNHLTINCTDMAGWFVYGLNQNKNLELKPFAPLMV